MTCCPCHCSVGSLDGGLERGDLTGRIVRISSQPVGEKTWDLNRSPWSA
jgi:hypothetical protein